MSGSDLPHPFPPASSLNRTEARDLGARVETAIGAGTVRETPRVDATLDNLRLMATAPSQTQRDQARRAIPAGAQASQTQAQRVVQAARPPRATA